jgi:hypothetical protein
MTPPDPKVDVPDAFVALLAEHVRKINRVIASGMHEGRALNEAAAALLDAARAEGLSLLVGDGGEELMASVARASAHVAKATATEAPISAGPRDPTRLPAKELTDRELVAEQTRVEKLWDSMFEPDEDGEVFEGHCGSPGEWMSERMDEIATEQARRTRKSEGGAA